jgi:hypothetical protein
MKKTKSRNISRVIRKITKRKVLGQLGCPDGGAGGDVCRAN